MNVHHLGSRHALPVMMTRLVNVGVRMAVLVNVRHVSIDVRMLKSGRRNGRRQHTDRQKVAQEDLQILPHN
jgi:hypothetical protein